MKMKDLTEMKNLLEAEKGYYADKFRKIKAKGSKATSQEIELQCFYEGKVSALEDVIKMIKERLDEAFIESLVRK